MGMAGVIASARPHPWRHHDHTIATPAADNHRSSRNAPSQVTMTGASMPTARMSPTASCAT
eukprot:6979805-Lingulodinium_polyedra.AAC.1